MLNNVKEGWGSRRIYVMVLLCPMISTPMFVTLPGVATAQGATGYLLCYTLIYFAFGIPLLYMEFIISQFTARDCIDVWKVSSCLSHIGYILILWQIFLVINNHITVSFTFHYLLISFENPVPYYTCGKWSTPFCDILKRNYTISEDCIRLKNSPKYCDDLYKTFPEHQYWNYKVFTKNDPIAWRVCLASAVISVITYLSCFKRVRSLKPFVTFYTLFPILGFTVLLLASMLQKGVVVLYQDALDTDFEQFFKSFRFSLALMQVVINMRLGTGLTFNLGASAPFRAPCYSNSVVVVIVCAATTALTVCTNAMMACPYAYNYGTKPLKVLNAHMSLIYEKIPRLLNEYQGGFFWVVLALTSLTLIVISTNVIIIHHLLHVAESRSAKIAKYPGLTTLLVVIILYIVTIPLLSVKGRKAMMDLRLIFSYISTFMTFLETIVFIIWYGWDRFTEDVHFMQGIQPKTYMKFAWLYSSAVLIYVFCYEIYTKYIEYTGGITYDVGWIAFILSMVLIVGITLLKLAVAAYKSKLSEMISLDRTWGPRDEVLQRSRAMFTAQAMTKEYLYRQYHLQAGIQARQKLSNCRT
ncbi:unnamed protein product [Chilo suppressalis]|uniref:Amino acid transporter transmembrane domain-containing protein n=1 Tax=Chilo suppressalis TaxID=168631 RepID=A0ABN8L6U7_CHISP|nr:unnamed protein product [Chilo suppressalis]